MSVPFTWLYKFHTMNINSLAALSNKKAWFSSLSSLNDPFEGCFNVSPPQTDEDINHLLKICSKTLFENKFKDPDNNKSLSQEEIFNFLSDTHEKNPLGLIDFLNELISDQETLFRNDFLNISTYCVSSDIPRDTRSHIANSLMWSHYADGLKGFCIKFNGDKLYHGFLQLNPNIKVKYAYVKYANKMHTVNFLDFFGEKLNGFDGALHTKHDMWGYECEIRFLTNQTGYINYPTDAIDSIYIGSRMPIEQKKLLADVVKKNFPNAKIHVVRFHKSSFSIEVGNWVD